MMIMRKLACIVPLFLFCACSGSDEPEISERPQSIPPKGTWATELEPSQPALLAVTTVGADLVTVGGPLLGDAGPAIHRRSGDSWSEVTPPAAWRGAMWWIWAAADDSVWVVGEAGQVARGPLDQLQMMDTGTLTSTYTVLYGTWGSGPDDVWIVGGAPRAPGGPTGTLLHWDGTALSAVELTGTASAALQGNLFKVWGTGPDDVTVVGARGMAIQYNGRQWARTLTHVAGPLTTVHGRGPYERYAVGGLNQGVVLRFDGYSWYEISDPFAPPLSGVFAAEDGHVWVAGEGGYLARWDGAVWHTVDTGLFRSFHAVHVDAAGAVFGVGGILSLSEEPRDGFAGRFGE